MWTLDTLWTLWTLRQAVTPAPPAPSANVTAVKKCASSRQPSPARATAEPHRTVFAGAVRGDWARHCSSSSLRNLDIWPPPPRLLCNITLIITLQIFTSPTLTITLNTHSSVSTHGSTNDNHFT